MNYTTLDAPGTDHSPACELSQNGILHNRPLVGSWQPRRHETQCRNMHDIYQIIIIIYLKTSNRHI